MSVPLTPGAAASPLVPPAKPALRLYNAEISHDGRWIAYQSDESGRFEVFVHPFPAIDKGRWQVSFGGGAYPLWARDGRELFFIDAKGTLMSVPVQPGTSFTRGPEVPLFAAGHYFVDTARDYDVANDGSRFLFVKNVTQRSAAPSVVVVSNWFDEVRAKMEAQ